MDDSEIAEAILDLKLNRRAKAAAERLLVEASLYIASGEPLPPELRTIVCDMLDHFADNEPRDAFPWLREKRAANRPNKNDESEHDVLEQLALLVRMHKAGAPLTLPADPGDVEALRRSAFYLAAAEIYPDANPAKLQQAARALKARWMKVPAARRAEVLRH